MDISDKASFLLVNKEEDAAAASENLSSMLAVSQFASPIVSAQDFSLPNFGTSSEEISVKQEAIVLQKASATEGPMTPLCIMPQNFTAEAMDVQCNLLLDSHHNDEIESLDVQPFNAQETITHNELLGVDGWRALPLGEEKISFTLNSISPASCTEPMIQNSLPSLGEGKSSGATAEKRPQNINSMEWNAPEGLALPLKSMAVGEGIVLGIDVLQTEVGDGPTNPIDVALSTNEGANSDMSSGETCKQVDSADAVSVTGYPGLQRETEPHDVSIHATNLHECATIIKDSDEIVTDEGSKAVLHIQTEGVKRSEEPSNSCLNVPGDNEMPKRIAVAERGVKHGGPASIPHDPVLNDSNGTLRTVLKGEDAESEMTVSVAIQHSKDVAVNDTHEKVGVDTAREIVGCNDPPQCSLNPALNDSIGVDKLWEANIESKPTMAVDNGLGELQRSELKMETGGGEVFNLEASKELKVEEETDHGSTQSQEMDMDVQDPEVPSQNFEGGLEMEQPKLEKDVPIDLEMLPMADDVFPERQMLLEEDDVSPEQQQPQLQKRGRKPGMKVIMKAEKDLSAGLLPESELEKEIEASSLKCSLENDQKRELRKRGRKAGTMKVAQKEEEDVCFVCFDGGKLILCDKRSCPKAYHVECTGRESEFFEKRGQWFCGWHVCSQCSKSAKLNCYLCPSALCNTCMKGANFLYIRKNRGLCEGCYPVVHMIEHNETINGDSVQADFDDKETYEGLFKEYWEDLKRKISLTSMELEKACKAKEAGGVPVDDGTNNDGEENMGEEDAGSTDSEDRPPTTRQVRLIKRKRLTRHSVIEDVSASEFEDNGSYDEIKPKGTPKKGRTKAPEFDGWVSRELADVIKSLKEDPKKQLPIFGVKKLLWRYIDDNKLSNPRQRGQIVCDERLQKLFGKKHVGRFEMMKLISLHVTSPNKLTTSKVRELHNGDNDVVEPDDSDENQLGKRKSRKKMDDNKRMKPHPSDYAAVNVKNVNLIYLKRSVLDELRNDPELENKAVGAFVRIRVPGSGNKNDACYRLVQVVGVKQIYDAHDPEKVTDVILEILNLHKREEVTADLVSNQDLVEEECLRLRQSVRCGFIKAMRVGELEERARALREAKVKDWREYELIRLSHLRDRASEKGRKKELRECVEKLQLLNTPEEKERLLKAPFNIDADPHMDPDYESDDEEILADDGQGEFTASQSFQETGFSMRYPDRGNNTGSSTEKHYNHRDSGNMTELPKIMLDSQLKSFAWGPKDLGCEDHVKQTVEMQAQGSKSSPHTPIDRGSISGTSWGDGARVREQTSTSWNQGSFGRKEVPWTGGNVQNNSGWRKNENIDAFAEFTSYNQGDVSAERALVPAFSPIHTPTTSGALVGAPAVSIINTATMVVDSEIEKVWCYQDPTGTVQGPFTMEQLRKWEKTNLFPLDLRIWRVTESQDASILLSDALMGRFNSGSFSGPAQKPNLPLGPTQGTSVNGFAVPSVQRPTIRPTGGPIGSNLSSGSAQGILANPMVTPQRPNVRSFPMSPIQGLNAHVLPAGSLQGPNAHGVRAPSIHGFLPGPTQGFNTHTFAPVPTQGAYVNNFTTAPTQGAPFNTLPPGSMQGSNVTGYPPNPAQGLNVPGQTHVQFVPGQPQAPIAFPAQMHAPNVLPGQAQAPNVVAGHMGPHFGNAPMGYAQGPLANNFPMDSTPGPVNTNFPQMGHVSTHSGRDFRNAAMPNRPANEWQEMGRRSGSAQHFDSRASKAMDGSNARGVVIPTRSPWKAQGRGAPCHDTREAHNQGHVGHGQRSKGLDSHQGSEGRFIPKKDLFCKYFSRGLCRKGEACDFRHH